MAMGAANNADAANLAGRWDGSWASHKTPHKGPLHGKFTQLDSAHYRVVFTGRFFKVVPFRYAVTLQVVAAQPGRVTMAGSSKLAFFGTFRYTAVVTANTFNASYSSAKDCGQFLLTRRCGG